MELREIKQNHMINLFSSQSCVLAAILIGLFSLFMVWLFHSRKSEPVKSPLPHRWQDKVDELGEQQLMGKRRLEEGESVVSAEDFSFVKTAGFDKSAILGDLSDVQQEIKEICLVLEKQDGGKDDFLAMFAIVRDKYPVIAESASIGILNGFIRENVPFHLSVEELENLWY
ncbi:hypothetical protein [Pedobacter helvus]|uniref:DUF4760 domain-containing protein n=1 Tax=Pedobacter helvus TaxID=2563444 RepID=A0ABW9JEH6_9SPHI|nr:hypothetical protein [Pedobacter ureilyticus]